MKTTYAHILSQRANEARLAAFGGSGTLSLIQAADAAQRGSQSLHAGRMVDVDTLLRQMRDAERGR